MTARMSMSMSMGMGMEETAWQLVGAGMRVRSCTDDGKGGRERGGEERRLDTDSTQMERGGGWSGVQFLSDGCDRS